MAQVLSKKLVYKQSSNYSSCLLSEVNTAQQMLAGLMIASCNPTADDILLEEKDRPESLDTESPGSLITVIRSLKNYWYLTFPREKLMFLEQLATPPKKSFVVYWGIQC